MMGKEYNEIEGEAGMPERHVNTVGLIRVMNTEK